MPKITRSGGATTAGKARQRERNAVTAQALGIKQQRSGSSGISLLVSHIEKKPLDEILAGDNVVEGPAVVGQVQDVRMLANRCLSLTLVVPMEYAHEAIQAGIDSRHMFTVMQLWHVPRPGLLRDRGILEDDDDGRDH